MPQAHKAQKVVELRSLVHSHYLKHASQKEGEPPLSVNQMVLKFAALHEYLDDGELIDYTTIRECLKRGRPVELRLLPHPQLHAPPLPPPPPLPLGGSRAAPRAPTLAPDDFPSVRALSPHTRLRIR